MKIPDYIYLFLAIVTSLLLFYLDTRTPLGYGVWDLYIIPVLLLSGTKKKMFLLTAMLSVLMILGLLLSPPGVPFEIAFLNRILIYCVFWIIALIISSRNNALNLAHKHSEELATANRELESFSYSVSHDLRGPLGVVNGFVNVLSEDYGECLNEQGRDYLLRIIDSVQKMQQLIDSLLSLSRIGRQEVKLENVNLSAIVSEYLQEIRSVEPARQAKFIIEQNVHTNADPKLIRVALENLLRNAWKFTSKNRETRIQFGKVTHDGKEVFYIRDNGVGFDKKDAQSIFEPFKRGHTEKDFGGTGVGLSIVQRVISRHGGKIWAEGEVGKGATFYFTLS